MRCGWKPGKADLAGHTPDGRRGTGNAWPQVRVTTTRFWEAFSAYFPVNYTGDVPSPGWIVLKLHVHSGRMGFAACPKGLVDP